MKLEEMLTQHQIYILQEMLNKPEWKIYKNFINNLVWEYLSTTESKDFLRGIKFAITKFENEIERA